MYTVTITSQGQVTIPAKIRRKLGLNKAKKALVNIEENRVIIEPVKDILELAGSLKTNIKANPRQIRDAFAKHLAQQATEGLPKNVLKKLGFRQTASNIFTAPKSVNNH